MLSPFNPTLWGPLTFNVPIAMLFTLFQKSLPILVFVSLALAYAVFRTRSTFLPFKSGHVSFKISLMTLRITDSSRRKFANITTLWHLHPWMLIWTIKPSKDLDPHHSTFMAHSIISWALSYHQMVSSHPLPNSISMIQRRQPIDVFKATLNWTLPSCWTCIPSSVAFILMLHSTNRPMKS